MKLNKIDSFRYILRIVLLIVLCSIIVFPILYLLSSSLFSQQDFNTIKVLPTKPIWNNYIKALNHRYFGYYIVNSIGTSLLTALVRTVIIIFASFAFTHLQFKGKKVILAALVLTLFVPQEAILYQNYKTIANLGILDTWLGIISTSLFSAAQMLLLMSSFTALGKECYNAAQIDGASDMNYIWSVLTPLSAPAIMTVAIQTLITSFNNYLWPLLVTNKPKTRTIQIGITMLGFTETGDTGAQMATLALITVPFLVLLALVKNRIEVALIRR
ncbi:MAG: carbohydrate ABC transporter permease [Sphaerochaetaceae bacterium]|nr:carbohydrate ABC transporter permease [Sphaerochaetaceae bacterium]